MRGVINAAAWLLFAALLVGLPALVLFLAGEPHASFTICCVAGFAVVVAGLEFIDSPVSGVLFLKGPLCGASTDSTSEWFLGPEMLNDRAQTLAAKAVGASCVLAGVLAVALIAAVGADQTGVPLSAKRALITGNGWDDFWLWSTMAATPVAMWPGSLVGTAIAYRLAAARAGRYRPWQSPQELDLPFGGPL